MTAKTPLHLPTSDEPLISCVMPTFGRPKFINEAVAMFLAQDYPHKELIVLNDCVGQEFQGDWPGVRIINHPSRFPSLGDKRNATIAAARGEIIAVWDDDDIYLPWRLSYSWNEMRRLGACFYRAAEFWAYWGENDLHDNQSTPGWLNHPNTLFTKAIWRHVGGYPSRGVGEDSEFFAKIHRELGQEFIKHPISRRDRFFIMRGMSDYQHMSITGGKNPLDTSPGIYPVAPAPIADPCLRSAYDRLLQEHNSIASASAGAFQLSVCIAVKNRSRIHHGDRELLLFPNCVQSLAAAANEVAGVELLIADFASDDWPLTEWISQNVGNLQHRVLTLAGPFSKGRGLNAAIGAAVGKRILLLDADMLIDAHVLRRAMEVVDAGRVWLPVCQCLDLDGNLDYWCDFGVGIVAFDQEAWQLAGPIPEFQSWGGEDNIFADKVQQHRGCVRERWPHLRHQWHPDHCRDQFYERPRKADYWEYVKHSEDVG